MIKVLTRGLAAAALVGALGVGVGSARGAAAHGIKAPHASDTDWSIMMPYFNPKTPYVVEETYKPTGPTNGTISGTVTPPNPTCTGKMTGTWDQFTGYVTMTMTFTGGCSGETINLTGQQDTNETRGVAVDNQIGTTSQFDGEPSKS